MATRPLTPEEKTYADELMTKARKAFADIADYDQARVDRLCRALAWATSNEKTFERIARMGVEESGIGDAEGRWASASRSRESCATSCARKA